MWNLNSKSRTVVCLFLLCCSLLWQYNLAFVVKKVAVRKEQAGWHHVATLQKMSSANRKSGLNVVPNSDYHPAGNGTDTTTTVEEHMMRQYLMSKSGGKRRRQRKRRERLEELYRKSSSISTSNDQPHVVEEQWMLRKKQPKEDDEKSSILPPFLSNTSDLVKARLLLLCAAALYGTNFSFVKILGETDMSVGVSATLRFGMAALATLPWLLHVEDDAEEAPSSTKSPSTVRRSRWSKLTDPSGVEWKATMAGLEVGIWVCAGYVAQAIGLETTAASKSAFLCSLAVVIVPILDVLIGKSLQSKQIIGALMAVVGVGFLELGGGEAAAAAAAADNASIFSSLSFGDYCSLVQPLAFGMGFWKMEHAMQEFPDQANRSTAAQLLAVFLGSLGYLAVTTTLLQDDSILSQHLPSLPELQQFLSDPMILFALFWTGIITTALTVYMETLALKTLSAAETTIIFSTEPLWGTACAAVLMGECLGMDAALGAGLIVCGCLFSNLGLDGIFSFLLPKEAKQQQQQQQLAITTTTTDIDPKEEKLEKEPLQLLPWSRQQPALGNGLAASFLAFFNRGPLLVGATEVDELVEQMVDSSADLLG